MRTEILSFVIEKAITTYSLFHLIRSDESHKFEDCESMTEDSSFELDLMYHNLESMRKMKLITITKDRHSQHFVEATLKGKLVMFSLTGNRSLLNEVIDSI